MHEARKHMLWCVNYGEASDPTETLPETATVGLQQKDHVIAVFPALHKVRLVLEIPLIWSLLLENW